MNIPVSAACGSNQDFPSLSFQVGRDRCSITARCVNGIVLMPEATHVPEAPGYCRGIFNHMGRVIPLIELRSLFGMPSLEMEQMDFSFSMEAGEQPASTAPQSIVIVLEDDSRAMGLIVDKVHAVEVIPPVNREQSGSFFLGSRFIADVGKSDRTSENILMLNEQALLDLCDSLQY